MLNIISCYILIRRRNMKKILLCLILGLFLIGFASAANLPNFKMIDGFNDTGDGLFLKYGSNNKVEQTFFILEYNEHDAADYLSNDTAYGYTIYNSTNGTYNFVDKPLKEIGSIELIEFEGKRYIVEQILKIKFFLGYGILCIIYLHLAFLKLFSNIFFASIFFISNFSLNKLSFFSFSKCILLTISYNFISFL